MESEVDPYSLPAPAGRQLHTVSSGLTTPTLYSQPPNAIEFFSNSHNIHISGGNFNALNSRENIWFQRLLQVAVITATHECGHDFQRPGCHKNTRSAVLMRLMDWVVGNIAPGAIFMWLYGDAGAGKSSIAQTFAIHCAQERRLLGSFFFWKNDPKRSTYAALIATLVYQAVTSVPALKVLVSAVIENDPAILDKHLKIQLISLLIEPINSLVSQGDFDHSTIPSLILIDGLDECSTSDAQCFLLKTFLDALPYCRHPLKILIASRPEVEIKAAFNSDPLTSHSVRLGLDDSFQPDEDIRTFIQDTFDMIRATHPVRHYIPPSWPGNDVIRELVDRSSGHFIFPSTVGKYISEPRQNPIKQLDIIMGVRPPPTDVNLPYTELNALYVHVLSAIPPDKIEMILNILGLVIIVSPTLSEFRHPPMDSIDDICLLLSIEPGDVETYLADLSSLVHIENQQDWCFEGSARSKCIRISHASFGDFLLDPARSLDFHLKPSIFFAKVAVICLARVSQSADGPCLPGGCWMEFLAHLLKHADLTPEVQKELLAFSLSRALEIHGSHSHMQYHFLNFFVDVTTIIRPLTNNEALVCHYQNGFDQSMKLIYDDGHSKNLLPVTALFDCQPIEWRIQEASSAEQRFRWHQAIFFRDYHGSPRMSDFRFLYASVKNDFSWLCCACSDKSETISSFFKDPCRAGPLAVTAATFSEAALLCCQWILWGSMPPGEFEDVNAIHHLAVAYLPQLLERSSFSSELVSTIRNDGLVEEIMKKTSGVLASDAVRSIQEYLERFDPEIPKEEFSESKPSNTSSSGQKPEITRWWNVTELLIYSVIFFVPVILVVSGARASRARH